MRIETAHTQARHRDSFRPSQLRRRADNPRENSGGEEGGHFAHGTCQDSRATRRRPPQKAMVGSPPQRVAKNSVWPGLRIADAREPRLADRTGGRRRRIHPAMQPAAPAPSPPRRRAHPRPSAGPFSRELFQPHRNLLSRHRQLIEPPRRADDRGLPASSGWASSHDIRTSGPTPAGSPQVSASFIGGWSGMWEGASSVRPYVWFPLAGARGTKQALVSIAVSQRLAGPLLFGRPDPPGGATPRRPPAKTPERSSALRAPHTPTQHLLRPKPDIAAIEVDLAETVL